MTLGQATRPPANASCPSVQPTWVFACSITTSRRVRRERRWSRRPQFLRAVVQATQLPSCANCVITALVVMSVLGAPAGVAGAAGGPPAGSGGGAPARGRAGAPSPPSGGGLYRAG